MSDARLRELERRAAQGDPGAWASLTHERARLGTIDADLATFLGQLAAAAAWCAANAGYAAEILGLAAGRITPRHARRVRATVIEALLEGAA
jgi:hypothetical protein